LSTAFAAHRLDGDRRDEDLCEEIAGDAWRALGRRSRLGIAIRDLAAFLRRPPAKAGYPSD
jgi:hypothetical protein